MKLRNLLLLLATTLAFVACKKTSEPATKPSDYRFDVVMTQAERISEIPEEGIGFEQNQFMLMFTNQEQGQLSLLIQGEDSETSLSAGTYSSSRGSLVIQGCAFATPDESVYTFTEGSVDVALTERVYTIEATLADANGDKYHFTYEGAIANMTDYDKYDVHVKLNQAERLLPEDKWEISKGDIGIMFKAGLDDNILCIVLTAEQGKDVITEGTYSSELGNLKVDEGHYLPTLQPSAIKFVSGEVVVKGDYDGYSFDMLFTDSDGKTYHFIYEGIVNKMLVNYENSEYYARCLGYFEGATYNFVVNLGRNIGQEYDNSTSKQRFVLDLYSEKVEKDANGNYKIPNGTYKLDNQDTTNEWTIGQGGSCLEYGFTEILFMDATLEVTDEGMTLQATELYLDGSAGATFTVVYSGETLAVEDSKFVAEPK
jgi:hypothetical protein